MVGWYQIKQVWSAAIADVSSAQQKDSFLSSATSRLGSFRVSWAKILFCGLFFPSFSYHLKFKIHQLLPCYRFGLWLLLEILAVVWLAPGGGLGGLGVLGVNVATAPGSCLGCNSLSGCRDWGQTGSAPKTG